MSETISIEHVKETCKVGHGSECCAHLVMGSGFECAKDSNLFMQIDLRLAEGTMNAVGDNCIGWSEIERTKEDE